jgi:hypothetical protein
MKTGRARTRYQSTVPGDPAVIRLSSAATYQIVPERRASWVALSDAAGRICGHVGWSDGRCDTTDGEWALELHRKAMSWKVAMRDLSTGETAAEGRQRGLALNTFTLTLAHSSKPMTLIRRPCSTRWSLWQRRKQVANIVVTPRLSGRGYYKGEVQCLAFAAEQDVAPALLLSLALIQAETSIPTVDAHLGGQWG